MKRYLSHLFYILGHLISYPMVYLDLGFLYQIYHGLMSLSVDFDIDYKVWNKPIINPQSQSPQETPMQ